jgi:hypothetical protein
MAMRPHPIAKTITPRNAVAQWKESISGRHREVAVGAAGGKPPDTIRSCAAGGAEEVEAGGDRICLAR